MALAKAALVSALTSILGDLDEDATAASKASQLADALDTFVKSGSVSFTAAAVGVGLVNGGGPVTGAVTVSGGTIA
jgi:hypothetical protein